MSVLKAVQGQIAGVDISSTSGRAGVANYNIQIRGQNSLVGGQPLFVVDGVIVDNINYLNPQDISKMDDAKTRRLPAIYGSLRIQWCGTGDYSFSEKIQKGAPTISFDSYYGIRKVARTPDFMDGDPAGAFIKEQFLLPTVLSTILPMIRIHGHEEISELARRGEEHDYFNWRDQVLQDGSTTRTTG